MSSVSTQQAEHSSTGQGGAPGHQEELSWQAAVTHESLPISFQHPRPAPEE